MPKINKFITNLPKMFSKINTGEKKYFLENKTNMADTEIVKIINIKTDQAITTVKELKNYINDLRNDLVKVDKGSKEYEKTLEEIANAQTKLTEVTKDAKNAMNYAEGSYKALNQELVNLRNEYRNLSAEERNSAEVGGRILTRIQELDTELKSIDATMGQYTRNVGNYKSAVDGLTVSYQTQRQELKALRVTLEQLEPGTDAYNKAFQRAAEITDSLQQQQEMLKYSSTDLGNQISNIRGIATGMAAGFSAVNAAMGLFGEKNEDVAKALLKVQQCMAIVQGLQGMDGLLKRTQGLSNAMKAWFTSTTQVTTALNAEAVATNTATVAQRGLNAAMKANPVGLVITAVMGLVTVLSLFSGKIKEAIKNNEKWNKVLGVLKGIAATVGAVLKAHFLVPLKEIVNYFGTLAKVMRDVFTGQWGKIEEDLKQGIKNARDIVVDSIEDIEGAYDGAVQKHLTKRERMRAADRTKELEELMELNEAKYGSDWKYTQDGKALYDEYFSNLAYQYDENSDDYKKAVLAKLRYDREYNDKQKAAADAAAKEEEERRKAAAKAAADAKKKAEQLEKEYQSKIAANYGATTGQLLDEYKERTKTVIEYYRNLKTESFELNEFIKGFLNAYEKDVNKLFDESNTRILETKAILNSLNDEEIKLVTDGKYDSKSFKEALNKLGQEGGIAIEEGIIYSLAAQTRRLSQEFNAKVIDSITNSSDVKRKLNDSIIQLFEKTIQPDLNKELQNLQNELDAFNFEIGVDIKQNGGQDLDLEKAFINSRIALQQLEVELNHYQQIIDYVNANPELLPSDEYDNAVQKVKELNLKIKQENERFADEMQSINKTYFQKQIETIENETSRGIAELQLKQGQEGMTLWKLLGGEDPATEKANMEKLYAIQLEGLTKIKDLWEQRKNDATLDYEERLEAERNYQSSLMDIQLLSLEQEKQQFEQRKQLIEAWKQQMQTAVSSIGELFGTLADYYKSDIDERKKRNDISDEEAEKEFETRVKPLMIAQATISMLQGMVSAFAGAMQLGPIAGPIVGGVLATLVGTMGAINIAKIKQQKYNSSGSGGGSASVPAPDTSYNYQPMYVANTTGQQDTEYLRNSLTEQPIRAYVVESDISQSQELSRKRNSEGSF